MLVGPDQRFQPERESHLERIHEMLLRIDHRPACNLLNFDATQCSCASRDVLVPLSQPMVLTQLGQNACCHTSCSASRLVSNLAHYLSCQLCILSSQDTIRPSLSTVRRDINLTHGLAFAEVTYPPPKHLESATDPAHRLSAALNHCAHPTALQPLVVPGLPSSPDSAGTW